MGSFDSIDFPAAHSMDTAWFAVDRDGHVAVFETGESGAAPTAAYLGEDHYELLDAIREALPRNDGVRDLAGLRRTHDGQPHFTPRGEWPVLVFVRAEAVDDALRARVAELGGREAKASEGIAFFVPSSYANKAFFDDLHARDVCLGCFSAFENEEADVVEHGIYRYEHAEDNWIAGPYALVGRPASPAKIDELPPEVAEKAIVYDGSFAEGRPIQPAEIWQSDSWGPTWLATDGKTVRPFPGREGEMEGVEASVEGQEGLVVKREPLEDVAEGTLYVPKERAEDEQKGAATQQKKPWWKLW